MNPFVFLSALALSLLASAQVDVIPPPDHVHAIDALRREFKPVDALGHLFEADSEYVLETTFDADGTLVSLRLVSRSGLKAEAGEPGATSRSAMSATSFANICARIQRAIPYGALHRRARTGLSMNSRTTFWDEYDRAVMERSEVGAPRGRRRAVASCTIWYFRRVDGVVEDKLSLLHLGPRVRVGRRLFLTTYDEFARLVVGARASFLAAGPVD